MNNPLFGDEITIHNLTAQPILRCHLGHTSTPKYLWTKTDFEYYQCPDCGLVWVNPQLTDASVSQIYAKRFKSKAFRRANSGNTLSYQRLLRNLEPYKQAGGTLLDVGTFTGNLLIAAREAGWERVEGTEISSSAVEFARRENNLTMHHGDLLDLDLKENYYDAITLSDVIEHVSKPIDTLERLYTLLRSGGVLFMDTPHFHSIPKMVYKERWSVFFPWHRTLFSVPNMREALVASGFEVKYIAAVGILPFTTGDSYQPGQFSGTDQSNSSLPNPSKQPTKQQRFIQRNKQWLRPIWLSVKRTQELPFHILSRAGIHIGSKLIVYAVKP